MAQTILCDSQDGLEAAFLLGNLENGQQLAMCPACTARWGLVMAQMILPPEEIAEQLKASPLRPAEDGQGEPAPRRRRKRQEAPKAEPEPTVETPEGLAEGAATAPDG